MLRGWFTNQGLSLSSSMDIYYVIPDKLVRFSQEVRLVQVIDKGFRLCRNCGFYAHQEDYAPEVYPRIICSNENPVIPLSRESFV